MKEIKEEIEWRVKENPNIAAIVVIIAGNDIKHGKRYCQELLDNIKQFNPKIYSAIPKYSRKFGDAQDKWDDEQEEWKKQQEEMAAVMGAAEARRKAVFERQLADANFCRQKADEAVLGSSG